MKKFSTFGLGTIVVDHQVMLERLPKDDHKGEVLDDRYQIGGPVPTALCLLRKFGMETTFQGKWAADQYGGMIEEDLREQGVAFEAPVCHNDSRTGFAHVWLEKETGKRTIASFRGSHVIEADEIDEKIIAGHDCLHSDGWSGEAAIKAMRIMRETGGRVFMDLGSPKPELDKLLRGVDTLNCPESLIPRLFETDDLEAGAKQLLEMGPREVTITRGAAGVCYFSKDESIEHPAFDVEVVDTNGAGDVFAGAMLYATMQEWLVEQRLKFACAAAALKCGRRGNREALPDLEKVREKSEESSKGRRYTEEDEGTGIGGEVVE